MFLGVYFCAFFLPLHLPIFSFPSYHILSPAGTELTKSQTGSNSPSSTLASPLPFLQGHPVRARVSTNPRPRSSLPFSASRSRSLAPRNSRECATARHSASVLRRRVSRYPSERRERIVRIMRMMMIKTQFPWPEPDVAKEDRETPM